MSLLGFDKVLSKLEGVEKEFLTKGIRLAQKEFRQNFDSESNAETSSSWAPVKRKTPPRILVQTGNLKSETISNKPEIRGNEATLTIDPLDENTGQGYAQYHEDGIGVTQREYVTQSESLSDAQESLLVGLLDKAFS